MGSKRLKPQFHNRDNLAKKKNERPCKHLQIAVPWCEVAELESGVENELQNICFLLWQSGVQQ